MKWFKWNYVFIGLIAIAIGVLFNGCGQNSDSTPTFNVHTSTSAS